MKKNKLSLKGLSVKSFVTDMDDEATQTAKGGFSSFTFAHVCYTYNLIDSCGQVCIPTGDECLPG